MSQQGLSDMGEAKFDRLIEEYIEGTAAGAGEMPADIFLDLLLKRIRTQTTTTLTLMIDVTNDQRS
jgi:hypothetical protein